MRMSLSEVIRLRSFPRGRNPANTGSLVSGPVASRTVPRLAHFRWLTQGYVSGRNLPEIGRFRAWGAPSG
jgi:hypothetical protein